ncbi:hypothetical protein RF11_14885 [Thelohanellus kitauei]|uniref:Uncharacterized protein n=1 Tax=Thelohanellus kitauei TaxID=669202 RepID=A0A0C2M8S1_THEKT|nr:hypothetical protein RF11_14885 [Thelohanellus kitauei]
MQGRKIQASSHNLQYFNKLYLNCINLLCLDVRFYWAIILAMIQINGFFFLAISSNLDILENSGWILYDATCKVCSKLFIQVYTIHGEFRDKITPLVYALLSQ